MFGSVSSAATAEALWQDVRYAVSMIPMEQVAGAQNVIVYRKPGVYACFPSLCRLADGRLYTRFGTRVHRSHIDNTGGSSGAVSTDDGKTWELTAEQFKNSRFLREDETQIVPSARGWVYVNEAELPHIKEEGRTWMKAREGTVAYLGDPRVVMTRPDGKTEIIELPTPTRSGVMSFHHDCSFLRMGNIWLTTIYGRHGPDGPGGVWGIRSEDDGHNWSVVDIHPVCGCDCSELCSD